MTTFDEFIADLTEALAPRAPDAVAALSGHLFSTHVADLALDADRRPSYAREP
jgi:hypothetical protein